jgi:hypothetical protein
MDVAVLPKVLRPYRADELVRLGSSADGGYVVDLAAVDASKFLLSCGVNEDWSFEEDFYARNRVPILALDGSVGESYFKDQVRRAFSRPWRLFWHWRIYRSYIRFYSGERQHQQVFVGNTLPNSRSLMDIVGDAISEQRRPFYIKMDIEGSEYEILDEVLALSGDLSGLIVEFHAVDQKLDHIVEFVQKLPLRLCHVHVNNNGGVTKDNIPTVIECTFSRFCSSEKSDAALPLPLDKANWHKLPDFELRFH